MGDQTYQDFARDEGTRAVLSTVVPAGDSSGFTTYFVFESAVAADATPPTAFVVAGTGWEFNKDINTTLGRNSKHGYVACDGAGSIIIAISSDDSTHLGAAITIKAGEVFSLEGFSVDSIEINAAAGTASTVRLVAW